ncbi:MAG: iron-containing alcohol dehydrogenase [Desulfobacterales bacterium]|nr:iron-containing alcohol dehydrogenase [Desulfobacterales bacterium]
MYSPGYYEFCCRVKIVAGHQALEKIPGLLNDLNANKPLILADKGVTGAGLVKILSAAIENQIEIGSIEDDIPQDSDLKVVNHLANVYRDKGCDAIIAVGGGSVMDTAKGVNIVVSENADDLMKFSGAGTLKHQLKPLIAIPTTSGTGSEVTVAAVIADHQKNKKMLFTSYFLLPNAAVLDSRMTLTLPPFFTAMTAMDAMTHAIEAYTCLAKNPISDAHAIRAIAMISQNLLNVVKNPGDKNGRLALANAATLAGVAFSNSMVGMVHTLGHSVGAICHVPHGTCMSIFLPYALEYNFHKIESFIAEILFPLGGEDMYRSTPKNQRAEKVIELARKLNQDLFDATNGRHSRFLKEIKDREGRQMVPKDKLTEIAATALGDGSIFYNPEELDYDDCLMVLNAAWEGVPLDRSRIKKG